MTIKSARGVQKEKKRDERENKRKVDNDRGREIEIINECDKLKCESEEPECESEEESGQGKNEREIRRLVLEIIEFKYRGFFSSIY